MKKVITVFFIVTVLLNIAFAVDKREQYTTPVPEVIQCESQETCKMTRIEVLLQFE
jgi:hypothetical protein